MRSNIENKIAIYGPYPPPLGGISVHIKRLVHYISQANLDFKIFNYGSGKNKEYLINKGRNPLNIITLLWMKGFSIFHFHQFFFLHYPFYLLFSSVRQKKIIITIHSERLLNYKYFMRQIAMFSIRNLKRSKILSVSLSLTQFLNENGIECTYMPAYVPPKNVNSVKIISEKELFLFSMWKVNRHLAENVYDLHLALSTLKEIHNSFKMLLLIGTEKQSDIAYLQNTIDSYGLREDIIVLYNKSIVQYVNNCRFLLRTNKSDGYGVSLQEAMDMGVPALATSVCERPRGTVLFESGNLSDLLSKIENVLKKPISHVLEKKQNLEYHHDLIDIYKTF